MEEEYPQNLGGDSWSFNDRLDQLKKIIDLHERSWKWMKIKGKLIKKKHKKQIKELETNTKQTREVLRDFRYRDSHTIHEVLNKDPEIERLTNDSQNDQEIEENIKQIMFSKRKELDRVNCEALKKEDELFKKKLEIEALKKSFGGKYIKSQAEIKSQNIAAEIQRVVLQQEAARILQSSYDKMRRLLRKDARKFDQILAGLKSDIIVQCQCVLKALELGQIATEDGGSLKKEYFNKLKYSKELGTNRTKQIRDLKRQIEGIKDVESILSNADVHRFQPIQTSGIEIYHKEVKELNDRLKSDFLHLKESFESRTPEEIFARAENVTRIKYRLIRQKEISEYWKKYALIRTQQMSVALEGLKHSLLQSQPVFLIVKRQYEDSLKEITKEVKQAKKKIANDGKFILDLRFFLIHFMRILQPISLESPICSLEKNQEEESFGAERPSQSAQESYNQKLVVIDEYEVGPPHPDKLDLDENHMFDIISLKVMLMKNQVENFTVSATDIDKIYYHYAFNLEPPSEVAEKEIVSTDRSKVSVATIEEKKLLRCGIKSRKEMKENSAAICEINEVKPTLQVQQLRIIKHECY